VSRLLDPERLRIGLLAGFVGVLVSSIANVAGRRTGVFADAMDLKYMSEWLVDPVASPKLAFKAGLAIHITLGTLAGAVYAAVARTFSVRSGMRVMVGNWLQMMLILFPLTGRGPFGIRRWWGLPAATLALNLLYGAVTGSLARAIEQRLRR